MKKRFLRRMYYKGVRIREKGSLFCFFDCKGDIVFSSSLAGIKEKIDALAEYI